MLIHTVPTMQRRCTRIVSAMRPCSVMLRRLLLPPPCQAGMFKDEAFQVRSTVDKRGRKVKGGKKNEDMRRYYRLKGEEQAEAQTAEGDAAPEEEQAAGGAGGDAQPAAAAAELAERQRAGAKGRAAATAATQAKRRGQADAQQSEQESEEEEGSDLDAEERAAQERWARMR